ncbi:MAG: HAMP domain-containing sensor histidine kinase [Clostridia bacterium]|nr:HAMP domain-containing sensor histidine kinase [Clostridia bacterium]
MSERSLSARIFLLTFALLACCCLLTYGFIALVMPLTYTASQTAQISKEAAALARELETASLSSCKSLLQRFAWRIGAQVAVLNEAQQVVLSANTHSDAEIEITVSSDGEDLPESFSFGDVQDGDGDDAGLYTQTIACSFRFSGDASPHTLMVSANLERVNQAAEALRHIWPWLVCAVGLLSLLGAALYARIVSALRAQNESLRQDVERERTMEAQRSAFFSAASHELKTPVTVIKGHLSGMLGSAPACPEWDEALARCLRAASRLERLVGELLTLSRMDAPDFSPRMEPLSLSELTLACVREMQELFDLREVALLSDVSPGLRVLGDPALLQKAIDSVLTNAALYSPPGAHARVCLRAEGDRCVLSVENAPAHIPEDSLPHLFEAFYRCEPSRSRATGGSGLGLYLTRAILSRHGAGCGVSNTASGVLAKLTFPLAASPLHAKHTNRP